MISLSLMSRNKYTADTFKSGNLAVKVCSKSLRNVQLDHCRAEDPWLTAKLVKSETRSLTED